MADRASTLRLVMALALSTFLHLGLIFSPALDRFLIDPSQQAMQIVLHATIVPHSDPAALRSAQAAGAARKAAWKARASASPKAVRSKSKTPAPQTASAQLGGPVTSEPEPPQPPPQSEQASERSEPERPSAGPPPSQEPEEPSPGPETREVTSIEDPGTPIYPPEAIQRGLESCVLAAVYLSPSGEVQAVRILHADVPEVFDQSVIDAHTGARYLPARQGGRNLPSRVLAVVSFVLKPDQVRNCAFKYAPAARKINPLPLSVPIGPSVVEDALRETQH